MACENVIPHFSQLKGFCPIWVRTWLFSVVAPTNVREQNPHLKGRSVVWETTCARRSEELVKVLLHCPHWKGLVGWQGQTCICNATRWVNVLWHCWHRHEVSSLTGLAGLGTLLLPRLLTSLSTSLATTGDRWSWRILSEDARLCCKEYVGINGGSFLVSGAEFLVSTKKDVYQHQELHTTPRINFHPTPK